MEFTELEKIPAKGTQEFVFNQTMVRIKDPKISLDFYQRILGMTLLKTLDFPEMKFTLYFLGYLRDEDLPVPENPIERTEYTFKQNYYWLMGDNRHGSADSRYWGFVPEDHVVGTASFVWFSKHEEIGVRWDRVFSFVK